MRTFLSILLLIVTLQTQAKDGSLTYNVGVSSGAVNGESYNEMNLGINYVIMNKIAWYNSIFSRNYSNDALTDTAGLDSSLRLYLVSTFGENDQDFISAFAGPGVRLIDKEKGSAFAEAGATVKLGGLSLGLGAKTILNELFDEDKPNDTQYFLNVSGGGSL